MHRDRDWAVGGGTSSSSWLAALRFTSDEEVPPPAALDRLRSTARFDRLRWRPDRWPVRLSVMQAGVGVLVCEALRERSEQRANKYPVADCTT